jgi:hypothetical protein
MIFATMPPINHRVPMIARRSAYGSVAAAAVAILAGLRALAQWRSGSPGPALLVSMVGCLFGFVSALVAEAVGSDRRELKIGLVGLIANALLAAGWGFAMIALLLRSS